MRLLKWSLLQAKLKINNEYRDADVKMNTIQACCLVFVNFVSIKQTKAIEG